MRYSVSFVWESNRKRLPFKIGKKDGRDENQFFIKDTKYYDCDYVICNLKN